MKLIILDFQDCFITATKSEKGKNIFFLGKRVVLEKLMQKGLYFPLCSTIDWMSMKEKILNETNCTLSTRVTLNSQGCQDCLPDEGKSTKPF